jgi:SAM-dependent methyltransferase
MGTERVHRLMKRFYPVELHPFRMFGSVASSFASGGYVVVDAGAGKESEVGALLRSKGARVVGFDLAMRGDPRIDYGRADLAALPLRDGSIDLVISRSVLEHLPEPIIVWREIARVLKPGGYFVALTPNAFDYVSVAARLIPHRFHSRIARSFDPRGESDFFPTFYRSNSVRDVRAFACSAGFSAVSVERLTQYPAALTFHWMAFLAGMAYERLTRLAPLAFLRPWLLIVARKRQPT